MSRFLAFTRRIQQNYQFNILQSWNISDRRMENTICVYMRNIYFMMSFFLILYLFPQQPRSHQLIPSIYYWQKMPH